MAAPVEWFRGPVVVCDYLATSTRQHLFRLDWRGGGYTKSSRGRVVKQLKPKQNRARFTIPFSLGKLFRMLPIVLSLNTRTPASAIIRHATRLNPVLKCVTVENRSIVGFFNAP